MKRHWHRKVISAGMLPALTLGFLPLTSICQLKADVLVAEDFSYGEGSEVEGLNGGDGAWMSEWKWASEVASEFAESNNAAAAAAARQATSLTSVKEGDGFALQIKDIGGGEESVRYFSREFSKYSGDRIFVAFDMQVLEAPDAESYFVLFLHERAPVTPTAYRLNIGVLNGNIVARYYHDPSNTVLGPPATAGENYRIVGEFLKSVPGEDSYFDGIRFWVNPKESDYLDPEGDFASDSQSDIRCKGVDTVGFLMRGAQAGAFKIGNLMLATTWDDLFKNPTQ